MVDLLIFSKDRAAQLELLLRSIEKNAVGIYSKIEVLWTASTVAHAKGYDVVVKEYEERVRFVRETSFQDQVWAWLESAGSFVSFLVDDAVFWRRLPHKKARFLPLSLRGGDYDYPFSVDGNVYLRRDVETLLFGLPFRDPTELEWFGDLHRSRLPFEKVNALEEPCLVGIAHNKVSPLGGAPHLGGDVEELCSRFLDGERLKIPTFDVSPPAHVLIEYEWEEKKV